jgi:SAM-dependent methyltransferase
MFCALPERPESILDVGCGSGQGFKSYMDAGSAVVGVDNDPAAIAKASRRLTDARVHDVESEPWTAEWEGSFEVVAFCDCLEHLTDPWKVLRDVRPLLRPGGRVVVSVPNLSHWRTLGKLALGRWRYVDGPGIMARSHLRFFTKQTVRDLFQEAGYSKPTFYFPWRTFHLERPERAMHALTLGRLPQLFYRSYTVSAQPSAATNEHVLRHLVGGDGPVALESQGAVDGQHGGVGAGVLGG